MSMLDRYRKPGGFYQLVSLLETCGQQKQEKFLEIIEKEDSKWSDALRVKMIDINRIYTWKDETIAEIIGTLQDLTLATVLHAAPKDIKERILKLLTHARRRKIDDLIGSSKPTPAEVITMQMKLIETVRKMAHDGFIRFDKFDVQLAIEDGLEEKLSRATPVDVHTESSAGSTTKSNSMFKIEYDSNESHTEDSKVSAAHESRHDAHSGSIKDPHKSHADAQQSQRDNGASSIELASLKKKVADLSKENSILRHELSVAKTKLEQIKKIA